ncbi:cupin domain-containing protein [Cellulomonas sp. zg-ZUI222]|uniref:Cupin domain-containing protein n=1 Tax=Cellulomonas wangleii TaxID=2816956 RepID=A0ABX8D2X7_9CELL|nr:MULTISPECIES: cupin domain-containing protein [Cellulomonas]MBO0899244.1 cupin domain-containing protein [Cellulomonas sp. zg-ZUI22]MBO0920094.1 cupin domain-containing protein [Cellulomonas wangleii]MBO0923477.1 cupin domain-containing protein [Cellulomonas wangleii]QVI61821.1 cupin domain-containing protein [Cellulomonas wangleii]
MTSLPGGVSVSRLRVYDWPAPDGVGRAGSGTPHLHVASTEAYVVLSGTGALHTLGPEGFVEHPLRPGVVVTVQPGVVHRAVNDGDLEVLVVMSNAGLPEAGDAVMTFPPPALADTVTYRDAAALPVGGAHAEVTDEHVAQAVRARRDLALQGYGQLLQAAARHGAAAALRPFHEAAVRLVRPSVPHWQDLWGRTAFAATDATAAVLEGLMRGAAPHLAHGRSERVESDPAPRRYGMCGRMETWDLR